MMFHVKVYLASLLGFLLIDAVWLAVVARGFYRKHLGYLLAEQPNWWAALAFYLLFVAGITVFATSPAIAVGSLGKALVLGGFFGLVAYATFDLTNQAIVEKWPWIVTLVDLTWGAILSATVSSIGYWVGRWLGSA